MADPAGHQVVQGAVQQSEGQDVHNQAGGQLLGQRHFLNEESRLDVDWRALRRTALPPQTIPD